MPIRESGRCPHEPRPGTVVCLYCRHEERVAGMGRRWTRIGMVGAAVVGCVVIGGALLASRNDDHLAGAPSGSPASAAAALASTTPSRRPAPPASPARPAVVAAAEAAPAAPATVASPTVASSSGRPGPIVAEGRTALPGGLFAVRTGDTVVVHFDTPLTRTRRPEKFERIVRETLPAIYGAMAGDALADVPAGQLLIDAGGLLDELPQRGVRLPTAEGGTLILWPATRPGRDGPLVVTYRATVLQ